MGKRRKQDEPAGVGVLALQPMPLPLVWDVKTVEGIGPDNQVQRAVLLQLATGAGSASYFFDPDSAARFLAHFANAARSAASGLDIVGQVPLDTPNGSEKTEGGQQ